MPQLSMPAHIGWNGGTRCADKQQLDKHKLSGASLADSEQLTYDAI